MSKTISIILKLLLFSSICNSQSYSKHPQRREINLECGVVDEENSSKQSDLLPWDVFFTKNGLTECLGSLISPKHVLTVAHCFAEDETDGIDLNIFKVVINPFGNKQIRDIEKVSIHENYRPEKQHYLSDIAIATVRNFGNNLQIRPACFVDDKNGLLKGDVGATYGVIDYTNIFQIDLWKNIPKSFFVVVHDEKSCEDQSPRDTFELLRSPDKFCTTSQSKKMCGIDGSGFYKRVGDKYYLGGVLVTAQINPTKPICDGGVPTFFTNISPYFSWIKGIISN
nr:venom prothrombin activator notecarin-D2-like [Onthophagus taurus]